MWKIITLFHASRGSVWKKRPFPVLCEATFSGALCVYMRVLSHRAYSRAASCAPVLTLIIICDHSVYSIHLCVLNLIPMSQYVLMLGSVYVSKTCFHVSLSFSLSNWCAQLMWIHVTSSHAIYPHVCPVLSSSFSFLMVVLFLNMRIQHVLLICTSPQMC